MSDSRYLIYISSLGYGYNVYLYIVRRNFAEYSLGKVTEYESEKDILRSELTRMYHNACEILYDNISDMVNNMGGVYFTIHYLSHQKDAVYKIAKVSLENKSVEILGTVEHMLFKHFPSLYDKTFVLENEIQNLKSEIETLKTMIHYQPGGEGEQEAKQHFQTMLN